MLPLLRSVEQSPAALRDVQHTLHLFATKVCLDDHHAQQRQGRMPLLYMCRLDAN